MANCPEKFSVERAVGSFCHVRPQWDPVYRSDSFDAAYQRLCEMVCVAANEGHELLGRGEFGIVG